MVRSRTSSYALILCVCAVFLSSPSLRAGAESRRMGGSCDTTAVNNGSPFTLHIEGTCQFRHLGATTVVAEQIIIPTSPTTVRITNTIVYTAANGDELHSSFVGTGTFTAEGVTFSGAETFSGGTGRFAGASGGMFDIGTATFTSPTTAVGHFTGDGSIVY